MLNCPSEFGATGLQQESQHTHLILLCSLFSHSTLEHEEEQLRAQLFSKSSETESHSKRSAPPPPPPPRGSHIQQLITNFFLP